MGDKGGCNKTTRSKAISPRSTCFVPVDCRCPLLLFVTAPHCCCSSLSFTSAVSYPIATRPLGSLSGSLSAWLMSRISDRDISFLLLLFLFISSSPIPATCISFPSRACMQPPSWPLQAPFSLHVSSLVSNNTTNPPASFYAKLCTALRLGPAG